MSQKSGKKVRISDAIDRDGAAFLADPYVEHESGDEEYSEAEAGPSQQYADPILPQTPVQTPSQQQRKDKERARKQRRSTIYMERNELDITNPNDRATVPMHISKEVIDNDYNQFIMEDNSDAGALRALKMQRDQLHLAHLAECNNVEQLKQLVDVMDLRYFRLNADKIQADSDNARLAAEIVKLRGQQIAPTSKEHLRTNTSINGDAEELRGSVKVTHRKLLPPLQRGPVDKSSRSMKLPDPPILSDGVKPTLEDWLSDMVGKFRSNADHYNSEDLRINYVKGRTDGNARDHIRERLDVRHPETFTTAEEILLILEQMMGIPKEHKRATARAEFKKLYQGQGKFAPFWAEFQRLASLLGMPPHMMLDELKDRMSLELREATQHLKPDTVYELADECMLQEPIQEQLRAARARNQRYTKKSLETKTTKKTVTSNSSSTKPNVVESSEVVKVRPEYSNSNKQELSNKGLCFVCKKAGHMAKDCLDKSAVIRTVEAKESEMSDSENE